MLILLLFNWKNELIWCHSKNVFSAFSNIPDNVFGNINSNDNGKKIDTSLFVQKHFMRTIFIEANIEEDIDLENQFRIKTSPDPISTRDACSKNYA